MEEMCGSMGRGLGWRVGASIAVAFGWLIFILIYAAFFSSGLSLFQNIIVTLASIIGGIMILGIVWASYGLRHARPMGEGPWTEGHRQDQGDGKPL